MAEATPRTIRLAPEGPFGRVLVWIFTLVLTAVSGSLVVEAFRDESVTVGKRVVVLLLAVTACVSYSVVFGFARRWWAMESKLLADDDRLVIDHPWYFKQRLMLPAEIIDFVAVDLPGRDFTRLALPRPPEFPVSWTTQNLRATNGQQLVPGEVNLAIVFDGLVELPERRLLARSGLVKQVAALFARAADPEQVSEVLEGVVPVRTLRSSDIPRISIPRGPRAALWFWSMLLWLGAMVLAIGPLFALVVYYR